MAKSFKVICPSNWIYKKAKNSEIIKMEEKLENPDQMIDFQTEYTKELHDMSDYPKIDFELIRKHFKEWEHHKVEDILNL